MYQTEFFIQYISVRESESILHKILFYEPTFRNS